MDNFTLPFASHVFVGLFHFSISCIPGSLSAFYSTIKLQNVYQNQAVSSEISVFCWLSLDLYRYPNIVMHFYSILKCSAYI